MYALRIKFPKEPIAIADAANRASLAVLEDELAALVAIVANACC